MSDETPVTPEEQLRAAVLARLVEITEGLMVMHNIQIDAIPKHAADAERIDPRTLGLTKAAYSVKETLEVLSIGRTSLYQLVKEKQLSPAKMGKKTLFLAVDLATLLLKLRGASPNLGGSLGKGRRRL